MSYWMNAISEQAINKSRWLLAALVVITLFFAFQATSLQINPSLFLISKDYEGRVQMDRARSHFSGVGEQIVLGVVTQKDSIINSESLNAIGELTKKLGAMTLIEETDSEKLKALAKDTKSQALIDGILNEGISASDETKIKALIDYASAEHLLKSKEIDYLNDLIVRISPVRKVRSLFNAEDMLQDGDSLQVHAVMETIPQDEAGLDQLREEIKANMLLNNAIMSRDGKGTLIQVELTINEEDSKNLQKIYDKALHVIDTVKTGDSIHLAGTATYYAAITEVVEKDNNKFFPVVMIVISLSLLFGMRSWQGVWMPILVALISVVWTMGTVTMLGYKLNLLTNMIPVFLLSLATSDSIHFLSRYYLFSEKMEKVAAVKLALSQQLMPMALSSLCTIFGFMALAYTKLEPVFEFGVFVACGVLYAFIITICLIPGLVPYLKLPKNIHAKRKDAALVRFVDRVCMAIDAVSTKQPRAWLAALVVAFIGLFAIGSQIKVDNESLASFSETARVRQDSNVLNQRFGGTVPIYVWLEGEQNDDMKKPEVIAAMRLIQARLKSHPEIGYTVSPTDFLDKIHSIFSGDPNAKLPADAASNLIAQYFLLYEFAEGSDLKDILDFSYRNARIFALGYTDKGSDWQKIVDDITQYSKSVLPSTVKAHIIGHGEQQAACIKEIVDDQISSFVISSGLIFLVMILLMRSFVLGIIAMIPIFMSVMLVGCFMVLKGTPIDIGTSMICGICLGVGIDYAIYYSSIFKQYMAETKGNYEESLQLTMGRVAYPIVVNGLSLAAGFAVLCLSGYAVISNLGLLVALSQVFSIFCTLSLLPIMIRAIKPKV